MVSILAKLSIRIGQRQKKNAASWSQFVGDVVDEKLKDPDEILAGLEVLNRTPADLQAACELLIQRREWSAQVAAGSKAESQHPKNLAKIQTEVELFKKLTEEHEARLIPILSQRDATVQQISTAADAKRRLLDTCSAESHQSATADIDQRIEETQAAQHDVAKRIRDCEIWVLGVDSQGDKAATADVAKLAAMRKKLETLQVEHSGCNSRMQSLQDERGEASASLLKPEAI